MAGQYSAVTGYGVLIGRNTGTPVSHAYEPPNAFTGARQSGVPSSSRLCDDGLGLPCARNVRNRAPRPTNET